MKYLFIIFAEFMILFDSGAKNLKFLPNLPLGEYRVNVIATQQCDVNRNASLQFNFFLSKTSRTTTELRGNVSIFNRALDDSLLFRCSMAVKDKIGTWQNNAYVYNSPQAYSSLKKLFGAEFEIIMNSLGANVTENLMPLGIYVSKGYDISNYPSNTNFPKQLFYGTYIFKVMYLEKNGYEVAGCFSFTVEIKRPWETE